MRANTHKARLSAIAIITEELKALWIVVLAEPSIELYARYKPPIERFAAMLVALAVYMVDCQEPPIFQTTASAPIAVVLEHLHSQLLMCSLAGLVIIIGLSCDPVTPPFIRTIALLACFSFASRARLSAAIIAQLVAFGRWFFEAPRTQIARALLLGATPHFRGNAAIFRAVIDFAVPRNKVYAAMLANSWVFHCLSLLLEIRLYGGGALVQVPARQRFMTPL
jgi:hypothetical protein